MLTQIILFVVLVYIIGAVFVTIVDDTYRTEHIHGYFGRALFWPYHLLRGEF